MSPTIDTGTMRAIRQPITPWETTNRLTGKTTLPPLAARTMPASSGPSRSAAGACIHRRKPPITIDSTTRAPHGRADANLRPMRVTLCGRFPIMDYCASSSASPFILRIVSISSLAAATSRASSVPRSTSETLTLPERKPG